MTTSFRDQVMDALLASLRTRCGTTFKYYSRKFMTWQDMIQNRQAAKGVIRQPALFLYDGIGFGGGVDNVDQRGRSGPAVVTMSRTIVVYATPPDIGQPGGRVAEPEAGGTIFYPLIESLEDDGFVSDSPSQNVFTLGGLVSHCWISGDIHFVTPDIDVSGQGMMTVPVSIMLLPKSR